MYGTLKFIDKQLYLINMHFTIAQTKAETVYGWKKQKMFNACKGKEQRSICNRTDALSILKDKC